MTISTYSVLEQSSQSHHPWHLSHKFSQILTNLSNLSNVTILPTLTLLYIPSNILSASPGPFVPDRERNPIRRVPERMSYSQKQREAFARMQDARLPPNHMVLGTPTGLLLNELRHSPRYVLCWTLNFFDIDYLSGIDYLSDIDYIFIHLGNSYFFDYLSDNDCVAGIGYIF
jgi:hypothetical protein